MPAKIFDIFITDNTNEQKEKFIFGDIIYVHV